mmetsp:Transcript_23630/g.46081  ORF Transcript_23630/g.46081 Transcript_23630/m.46081 type:complete len:496 (+) Transcript_23630:2-1489(+)
MAARLQPLFVARGCYKGGVIFARGATRGGRRAMSSAAVIETDNPYTGEVACSVPVSDPQAAMRLVEESAVAQREWATSPLEKRIEVVQGMIGYFEANKDRIAADISSMMGKPLNQAKGEIGGVAERGNAFCDLAPAALADDMLPEKEGFFRKIAREPVGVVLSIAPWNYPLLTGVNSIIPGVLSGNSVLVKHSPRTPLCADHFEKAFLEAGAPEGLVKALHVENETVDAVIQATQVGTVSFTGSVATGHKVYSSVAKRFIDCTLELGGKDAAYVAEDADLDQAVETLVDGAFYNAGQSCCGIERIYVSEALYDGFLEKATKIVSSYVLGDPFDPNTTMGPVAMPGQPAFLQAQVEDAKAKGARILTGGSPATDGAGKGRFFLPTIAADCSHDMDIMREESFGPVVAVTPVKDDEHALNLMNDSKYGLTAVLFTTSVERAHAMTPRLEAGTVFMNRCDYLDPLLPWSGVKDTGKGVSLSMHGFRAYNRLKGYHFRL